MAVYKYLFFSFFLGFLFLSCSSDDSPKTPQITLDRALSGKEFILGNVIACAASNKDPDVVSIFLYPRGGATNINYYQTKSINVDETDFSAYAKGTGDLIDVFNGFLLKYEIVPITEKWVIVSFEEEGKIHLSNPIRLKQNSKPTEYLPENITVNSTTIMPVFTWIDGTFDDSEIYFQVLSNENEDLLSGTYTLNKMFQYYKLENVVLNITEQRPPSLEKNTNYGFTLLAVSKDNWVNLFSANTFSIP